MNRKETALPEYLFHQGTNFHAYDYLGCHRTPAGDGYLFRTWAPNAAAVSVTGDFCGWGEGVPLSRESEKGIYGGSVPADLVAPGSYYKFRITAKDGRVILKGDPYAFRSEGGAGGASVVCDPSEFCFSDGEWMEERARCFGKKNGVPFAAPLSIYELHAASFARHRDGRYYTYRELADTLVSYVKYMGFTHVELMPMAEYPYDGSWGYQICAYYAPTPRFGSPDDFRYLVDHLHNAGVGVLMDWVPAHFPKDAWGLFEFDGGPTYEYQGHDRMESRGWGTRYFDVGREEVQSFLVSNALYWLREFHLDGLRVDAVASMLYRDYDRGEGEWFPNSYGGRENLEAIAFFRKLNGAVREEFPDALMIAEESTAFPGVTAPVEEGGLGFSLKWNMGFANDFFAYLQKDPIFRRYHHAALTFPMMYAYSEHFILPVSHDEVVYGKGSLYGKIPGSAWDKYRTLRAALLFLMTFPGKKMLFMGTEYGKEGEWDYRVGLDFSALGDEGHRSLREYVAALNRFYLATPALWEADFTPDGFLWIDPDDADGNTVAYRRRSLAGEEIIVLISFSGADRPAYRLPLPEHGVYDVVFSTGTAPGKTAYPTEKDDGGNPYLTMDLPALSGVLLRRHDPALCLAVSLADFTPETHLADGEGSASC